ncbi:unnamed protein product [Blepharisma stoltei]|uniref:Uncharacterized protein n=1 Tax=Blepharisma stoltei TaxID=1481888 RepID=A0AAU9IQW5_9CILI|nr:unnamed protein product [Blepharisma stoltei]
MTTKDHEDASIIRIQKLIRGTLARKSLLVTMPEYSAFIFRKRNRENYGPKIMYDSNMIFDDFANELRRYKLKNTAKPPGISNSKIEKKAEDSKDSEKKSEEDVTINEPEVKENPGQDEKIVNKEENFKENLEEKKIENNESREMVEKNEKPNPDYLNLDKLNEIDKKSIQGISVRADYSPDSSRRDSVTSDIDGDISPELSKDISAGDVNTSRHKDILNSDIEGISDIEKEEIGTIIHDKSQDQINENELGGRNSGSDKEENSDLYIKEATENSQNKETENLKEMQTYDEKSENKISGIINEKDGTPNAENLQKNIQIDQVEKEIGGEEEIANGEEIEENGQNENSLIKEEKSDIVHKNNQDIALDYIPENSCKDSAEEEKIKINEENTVTKEDNSEDTSERLKNKDLVEFQNKEQQSQSKEESSQEEDKASNLLEEKQDLNKNQLQNETSQVANKIEICENVEKEEAAKAAINGPEKEIAKIDSIQENANRKKSLASMRKNEEEKVLITNKDILKDNQNTKKAEEEIYKHEKVGVNKDSPKENNSGSSLENKNKEVENPSEKEILKENQGNSSEVPEVQQNPTEIKLIHENTKTAIITLEVQSERNSDSLEKVKADQPIKNDAEFNLEKANLSNSFRDSPARKIEPNLEEAKENSPASSKVIAQEIIKDDKSSSQNNADKTDGQQIVENPIDSDSIVKQEAEKLIRKNSMKSSTPNNFEDSKIDIKNEQKVMPENDTNKSQEPLAGIDNSENGQDKSKNNTAEISAEFPIKNELILAKKESNTEKIIKEEDTSNYFEKEYDSTQKIPEDFARLKDKENEEKPSKIIKQDTQRSEKVKRYPDNSEVSKNEIDPEEKELEKNYDKEDYKVAENSEKEKVQRQEDQSIYEKINLDSKSPRKKSIKANISITENKSKQERDQTIAPKYYMPALISGIKPEVVPENRKEFNTTDHIINHKPEEASENPPAAENKIRANSDNFQNPPSKKFDSPSKQPFHRNFQKKSERKADNTDKKDKKINSQTSKPSKSHELEEGKGLTLEHNKNLEKIIGSDIFADQDFQNQNPLFNPPPQSVKHQKSKPPLPKEEKNSSFLQEELKDLKKLPSNKSHQTPAFSIYSDGSSYLSDKSINVISSRVTPIQSAINSQDPINPLWSQSPNDFLQKDPDSMLRKNFYPNQELRSSKNPILPHLDQTATLTKKRSPKSQDFFENHPQKIPSDTTNFSSTPAKFKSKSLNQTHYHANPYNNEPADLNFDPSIYKTKKSKTKNSKELDDLTNPKTAGQSKKSTSYGKYRFQYNLQPKSTTNVLVLDKGSPYELEKGMKMLQEFFGVKVDIVDNNHKKKIRIIKPKLQNIRLPAIKTKKVMKKENLIL